MRSSLSALVMLLLLLGSLRSQVVWEHIGPGSQFVTACMVFDAANQRFFVADGQPPQIREWNGSAWQTIATVPYPVTVVSFKACFDTLRSRVVLIGCRVNGYLGTCILEWDGTNWYLFNPPALQSVYGWYGSIIWDPVRGKCVITDLLCREWDGTVLGNLGSTPSSPYGLCFNALSGRPMLPSVPFQELHSNNTWAPLPATVQGQHMGTTFHEPVSNTIQTMPNQGYSYLPEVWDGTSWHIATVGNVSTGWQNIHTLALDPNNNEIRGIDQQGTFRVVRGPTGSTLPFGVGCPGALGIPALTVAASTYTTPVPVVGKTITFNAQGILPYPLGVTYYLVGASNTFWDNTPLPLDMSVFNMPGCSMNQSLDMYAAPTYGSMQVDVPGVPGLVGTTWYVQAMGLELLGPSGPGVCMSPSLACTIGVNW